MSQLGLAAHKEGNDLCEEERTQRILAAQLITKKEYQLLIKKKDKTRLSSSEHDAMRRYEVESFYLTDATEEVVKRDNNGRFRSEVLNYECYTAADSQLIALDQIDENNGVHVTDKAHRLLWKQTMKDILVSSSLANEESLILTNTILRGDQLGSFIQTCVKHKHRIAQLFNMSLRGDIRKKPVQQLNKLLGLMGLGAIKVRTIKEEGKKIYLYTIPQESVDSLEEIVDRRKDNETRNQWHTTRENTTRGRLFTKESPLRIPRTYRDIYPRKTPILCLVKDEMET